MNLQKKKLNKSTKHIKDMFGDIAPKYDALNKILSLGKDKKWRKQAVHFALSTQKSNNIKIADVGSGTGDLSIEFADAIYNLNAKSTIISLDIAMPMLKIAKTKRKIYNDITISEINSNAIFLPIKPNSFNVISAAFTVRNISNLNAFLVEVYETLQPGGILSILEFVPKNKNKLGIFQTLYLKYAVPFLGNLLSHSKFDAYGYLFRSIQEYYSQDEFTKLLEQAGFSNVKIENLFMGFVSLIIAQKN